MFSLLKPQRKAAHRGKRFHSGLAQTMSRRVSVFFLAVLLCGAGMIGYYLFAIGRETQQGQRIQPLIDSGLSSDASIKFDERFSDQRFRWPWQQNEPYGGDEASFAEMWLNSHIIAELLLDYYYCNSSSYYCLVWLLGRLQKGVSYWENAISLAVHGDANNDGVSNYDSLLGPNADVLNTFGPNPIAVYGLERNLSKEAILHLKSWETDGQMDEWEKEVIDLMLSGKISEDRVEWIVKNIEPNPATIYALERQLPNDLVKLTEPLGNDDKLAEWERYIIDRVQELPSIYIDWALGKAEGRRALTGWEKYVADRVGRLPGCFVEQVLNDGDVDYEEWMQTQFLGRFAEEDLEEKGAEWICNPDLDDDGFTNEFETRVASTDPYVSNERYAVLVCGDDLPLLWSDQIRAVEESLTSEPNPFGRTIWTSESKPYGGFREENVHRLFGQNMTFHNLRQVIDDLAERLDEDDIILFLFAGHGEKNYITFAERDVSYEEINVELVRLQARVVCCIIDACYSGSAIAYLQSEDRVVMTSSSKAEKTYGGTLCYALFSAMQNRTNDQDSNGYCSVLESFYGAKISLEKSGNHPQLSSETLAGETYLVELYLEEDRS